MPNTIVDGAMVEGGAVVEGVNDVERHGLIGAASNSAGSFISFQKPLRHSDEVLVEAAHQSRTPRQSKIRKHTCARQTDANIVDPSGFFTNTSLLIPNRKARNRGWIF